MVSDKDYHDWPAWMLGGVLNGSPTRTTWKEERRLLLLKEGKIQGTRKQQIFLYKETGLLFHSLMNSDTLSFIKKKM